MPDGVDRSSDRAVYQQIADQLREDILAGRLDPGRKLPSERSLIDKYDTARGTVRQALAVLRTEGLIEVEHGRGAFVREHPPIRRLAHDRFARRHREAGKAAFLAEMEHAGRQADVEILQLGPEPASAEVARRLDIRKGQKVLVRRRRYLADDRPVEVATSYLPWTLVEGTAICGPDTGPGGIYARLENLGHRLGRFTEEVSARMPHPDEVKALELSTGVPIFRLVRTAFDEEELPVEVCDTIMAADRYVLSYELPAD